MGDNRKEALVQHYCSGNSVAWNALQEHMSKCISMHMIMILLCKVTIILTEAKEVIYQATVTKEDNHKEETYIGLTSDIGYCKCNTIYFCKFYFLNSNLTFGQVLMNCELHG